MRRTLLAAVLAATCLLTNAPNSAHGADPLRLENPRSQRWQIGLRITATGACSGIVATLPVPLDWPEQQVKIVDQEISRQVRPLSYRTLPPGGARQMIVAIPRLAAGETAVALVTFEVTKHDILGAESTAAWSIPARVDAKLRPYLGTSPSIETNHPEITRLAGEIGQEATTDWEKVKAIYDWVRANIRFDVAPRRARRLRRVDVAVHRLVPGQRHSRPLGVGARPLLSGILPAGRRRTGLLVSVPGSRSRSFRQDAGSAADPAKRRQLSRAGRDRAQTVCRPDLSRQERPGRSAGRVDLPTADRNARQLSFRAKDGGGPRAPTAGRWLREDFCTVAPRPAVGGTAGRRRQPPS